MVSICVGDEEAFDILLEAGADPFATNTRDKKFRTTDYSVQSLGNSGLHFARTLAGRGLSLESSKRYAPDLFVTAVIAQRFQLADWLLTQNMSPLRLHVEVNPLGFAIIARSLSAVRYLIKTDLFRNDGYMVYYHHHDEGWGATRLAMALFEPTQEDVDP